MVVERGQSDHMEPFDIELSVLSHDVGMVPAYHTGGGMIVMRMGHQNDVGRGVGRLDPDGLAVMGVHDDRQLGIGELEA